MLCFGEDSKNEQIDISSSVTSGIDVSKVHLLLVGHWHEMLRLINLVYT